MLLGLTSPSTSNTTNTDQEAPIVSNGDPVTGGDMGQTPPPK